MRRSSLSTAAAAAVIGLRRRNRSFGGDLYTRPARSGFRHEPVPRRLRRLRRPERRGVPEQRGRALDRRQSRRSEQHDRRLAAGSLVERGSRGLLAGVTTNGGASWTIVNGLKTSLCTGGTAANGGGYQRATDPWVTFGPTGIAYQLSLSFNDVAPPITAFDFDHALSPRGRRTAA